jgi:drug/metabolite transporter (DMT)-like permease
MLAILGASLAWAIDNNLTRKISLADATWIAAVKGLVSGSMNLLLALLLGASIPALPFLAGAMVIGLFSYGVSLALFVVGLRHLGTARTGAYFSVAPFFGALLALIMGEPLTMPLVIAGTLMALGTWLHLTERHEHEHSHNALSHEHEHEHDEHHDHTHDETVAPGVRHHHPHVHQPLVHTHPHFPDAHHRHH